ncbi:MAG: NAD(P)-binding domain-containing protein [Actinomycetota bacterium]|nr:NAD(P)-binding domain-containing protein [Actinomycetota bacterium]
MLVGLVGSGNMARAMARGWSVPVLCSDAGSGRAAELAAEVGGEAIASNLELAQRADLVVLCHKPAQLDAVAGEIAAVGKPVASVLAGVSIEALQTAYAESAVFRFMPNTPVEVRRGVLCYASASGVDQALESRVLEHFGRLGAIEEVPEHQFEVAMALVGCAPAYLALIADAQARAAETRGLDGAAAARLVTHAMAGTAALIEARGHDAAAVRREVASPGGYTERGLRVLEAAGVPAAFAAAMDAVTHVRA